MEGTEEAKRQREQMERYLRWVEEEGGIEGPTHLSTWFKPFQIERLNWLKQHCVGKIMELGCCYGYVLAYCNGHIGVDWNERSIALAKILSPEREFVVADVRKLPFPDSFVDTVMLCDVLEHIDWKDVPEAVSEARRVTRDKILIAIPDGETDTAETRNFKHRWLLTRYREVELMDMLENYKRRRTSHFIFFEVLKASV